ncbi:variant erythrocyte surface antigen-1 family protein, partial [Babesia divergens]
MLPCLYYALQYLYKQCKGDWSGQKISNNNSSLRHFLSGMGYNVKNDLTSSVQGSSIPGLLTGLFTSPKGPLQSLYDVSKKYFTSPSHSLSHVSSTSRSQSPPKDPLTVREILLWLYGLRFQKSFPSLVLYCSSLCLPFGNSFNPDAFCYYIYTCCFLLPVSFISVIQCPDGSPSFLPSPSDWKDFSYPSDTLELFENFCDFVRKVYIALDFLKFQCKNYADLGGWQFCFFGSKCSVNSGSGSFSASSGCSSCPNSKTYLCTGSSGSNWDVHGKHCDPKGGGQCINANGSGKCSESTHNTPRKPCIPCPHPLQRFLTATSDSPSSDPKSLFALPGTTPMGFSQQKLSPTAKSGNSLRAVIILFCNSGFYPLTRLAEFSVCVTLRPPESLFELFSFFQKFVSSDVFKSHFESYVEGEPGTYSGKSLKTALQNLNGARNSHSGSHPFDLKSLYDCSSTKGLTCGKYLYPLIADAYNIFIENFLGTYLSFVCHLAPTFKTLLEEFKGKFSLCCSSGSCSSIVKCPCALPLIYSRGFTFMLPEILNKKAQKCSNFIDQLGKVVGQGSPLQDLLDAIDAFLWSIRFP